VPKLSGFCLLIKRAVYDKIGGLDEQFGLGFFDEYDLCERARRAGFELAVAHDLFVHHFGSRTFAGNGIDAGKVLDENGRRFADKWVWPGSMGDGSHFSRGRQCLDLARSLTKGKMKVEKKISRKDAKAQRTQMGPGRRQAASYMGACGPIGVFRNSLPPSPPSQRLLCALA
jgi:GT2 family glycosyltransferase